MTVPPSRTLSAASFLRREPRQVRSLDRLDRLLAATWELLAEEGYPGVTVANLKARTGMPHGTIYDVVADPRDLVAVLVVRAFDEVHETLVANAASVHDARSAFEFVRSGVADFIGQYRTSATLRAAIAGIDADPAYRWISIVDSERNARVVADTITQFTAADPTALFERCLLMSHLVGTAAALAVDLDEGVVASADGDAIVEAMQFVLESTLDRSIAPAACSSSSASRSSGVLGGHATVDRDDRAGEVRGGG